MAATKDTTTSSTPKENESLLTKAARIIPGLSSSSTPQDSTTTKKSRSRGNKQHKKDQISSPLTHTAVGGQPSEGAAPATAATAAVGQQDELDLPIEDKKTSAVEACSKRIRAANKKLQRIATYEEKTEALNADQQRAVASKPALQSVVKELEELLAILKAEETEDEQRNKRVAALDEKRKTRDLDLAKVEAQKSSQQDLVLLFQFLHLHGIFSPSQSAGFAPPVVPPVVQQATGQEAAAVRYLYDQFANGPLLGGHGDAIEKLNKVSTGADEEVLGGVTYSRVKELIAGLTSTPSTDKPASALPTLETEQPIPESSAAATPNDSVTALVDGVTDGAPTSQPAQAEAGAPSFLNASELEQVPSAEERVTEWAEDVVPAAAPAPTAEQPPAPIDWASEENGHELPSLPELAPPVAAAATGNTSAETANVVPPQGDGFQPARSARRGGPERGGRGGRGGSFRGGERGGHRGPRGPRLGPDGQPLPQGQGQGQGQRDGQKQGNWRGPREQREPREGGGAPRSGDRPRSGRGRGSYRGGRGGQGQGQGQANAGAPASGGDNSPAPAAAAASPASANL